ncbi:MAG: DUF4157 domain-containing protein [Polyangiaceae bacterium]|nr:DUF4157 domain-containing protein [Polyangiaceae bacterium]
MSQPARTSAPSPSTAKVAAQAAPKVQTSAESVSAGGEPSFSGGGSPLPPTTRQRMERSFGRPFDSVRVHNDAQGGEFAKSHQAEAVTSGEHIAFRQGRYAPGTESGERLIGHELAHVAQQGSTGGGAVQAKSEVSTPNEPAEVQADAAGDRAARGEPAGVSPGLYSTRSRLMRKATPGLSPVTPVPHGADAAKTAGPTPAPEATGAAGPSGPSQKKKKRPGETGPETPGPQADQPMGAAAGAMEGGAPDKEKKGDSTQEGVPTQEGAPTQQGESTQAADAAAGEKAPVSETRRKKAGEKEGKGRERPKTLRDKIAASAAQKMEDEAREKAQKPASAPFADALKAGAVTAKKGTEKPGEAGGKQSGEPDKGETIAGKGGADLTAVAKKPGEPDKPGEASQPAKPDKGEGAAGKGADLTAIAKKPGEGSTPGEAKKPGEGSTPGEAKKAEEKGKGGKGTPEGEAGPAAEGVPGKEGEGAKGPQKPGEEEGKKKEGEPEDGKEKKGEAAQGEQAKEDAAQKKGVTGADAKGLEGGPEGGPKDGGPAGAERAPAGGGGGGGAPGAGGGGGDGGGGGGAESKEGEAAEEKMDEKQPEDEKAAEEQHDQESQGEGGGGGGGGESDAEGGGGGGGESEAEAGGGGEAPTPEPTDAGGGGGGADVDSAAEGGGSGGGETAPAPDKEESESAAKSKETAQENKLAAKEQEADAEVKAENEEEAEVDKAQEEGEKTQAAPSEEDAKLSPGEESAGVAAASESVGGGGEGGGGGGGGGAIPDKKEQAPPDVSGQKPAAAMGALKGQTPLAVKKAIGGVSKSVESSVSEKQNTIADNPPGRPISTGMPGKAGKTEVDQGGGEGEQKTEETPEGEKVEVPEPEPLPEPGPAAVDAVSTPATSGDDSGEMSKADAENMGSAVSDMPTTDPEVTTDPGPAPKLALEGDADPAQMTAQRAEMDESLTKAHEQGKADAQKPMGEDEIAPQETDETAVAKVSSRAGGRGGAPGGGAATPDEETASIIAQEKSPGEIDTALEKGEGDVEAEEQKHEEKVAAEGEKTEQETDQAEANAESEQVAKKASAKKNITKTRADWSDEQEKTVTDAQTEAEKQQTEGEEKIDTGKAAAEEKAEGELEEGERQAKAKKSEKEEEAENEKKKGEKESSGFFGWLASKAKAFFNKIKQAIKSIISALRTLVKEIIEARRRAALAEIEAERQRAVDEIRARRDKMLAEADAALADFPELREKRRAEILAEAQAAEDEVNKRADKLKKETNEKYDKMAAAVDKAFDLLEKGLMAIVDAVASVVDKVIKAAEAIAKALGTFMVLIKDIASGPGQWISNLGAAVVDGIKNHLVKAMKKALTEWFNSKIEEVLGLPVDVLKALFKGGITLAKIGKIAWEALKAAIPGILIQLLIEKLVAMIVPAAGAVMAIIEGIQAAWGTISRIIAAIDMFITFLKAVKGGGAGPAFANAVAAAAIAVIDFVANWLILRLMKPAKKVASGLAAMAKKIIAKIKKALKKVGKKLKKAFKKIGKALKKAGKKLFGKKKKGKGKKKDKKKDKDKDKKKKEKEAEKRLKRAHKAITSRLRRPKKGQDARAIIQRVASQHKVSATISPGADTWEVTLTVNPRKKAQLKKTDNKDVAAAGEAAKGDAGAVLAEADKLKGAIDAAAAPKKPSETGEAKEQAKIDEIKGSKDQTFVPTKPGHIKDDPTVKGPGFDAASLKSEKGGDVLEIFEEKAGTPRVMLGHASSRPMPDPTKKEPIKTTGEGSATAKVASDPATAKKVAENKAVLVQDGRQQQNQLSGITSSLKRNIDKMFKTLENGVKKKKVDPSVEQKVKSILAGKGGLVRIVIDLDKGASFSANDLEAAKALIKHALDALKGRMEGTKTQIEAVIREAGKDSDTVIYG